MNTNGMYSVVSVCGWSIILFDINKVDRLTMS